MDGYFYLDQPALLKFRVFHMLLEICECRGMLQCFAFSVTCAFRINSLNFRVTHWCGSLLVPRYLLSKCQALRCTVDEIDVLFMSVKYFLFQLPTFLFIISLLPIMGTMLLVR